MRSRLNKYTIVFSILALTMLSVAVSAQSTQPDPMVQAFADFHVQNNQAFNTQTQNLLNYFEDIDIQKGLPQDFTEKFSPPLTLDNVSCQENLSSSCLNFYFQQNLDQLIPEMQSSLNYIDIQDLDNLSDRAAQGAQARFTFMNEQFDASILATQSSLEFYQQLLQAYPLHISYQATQDQLDLLQSNLQDLENYVKQYPSKYNNVTTPYCQ